MSSTKTKLYFNALIYLSQQSATITITTPIPSISHLILWLLLFYQQVPDKSLKFTHLADLLYGYIRAICLCARFNICLCYRLSIIFKNKYSALFFLRENNKNIYAILSLFCSSNILRSKCQVFHSIFIFCSLFFALKDNCVWPTVPGIYVYIVIYISIHLYICLQPPIDYMNVCILNV